MAVAEPADLPSDAEPADVPSDAPLPPAWLYSFNVGVEAEAAGRAPTKNYMMLRRDLAALPWVLAGRHDIVLARPPRPEFLSALSEAGVCEMPCFCEKVPKGRAVAGSRPWGIAGDHLRRSNVERYRSDVAVCRSLEAIREAVKLHGPKVVLKAEFSSAGMGVRTCEGVAALDPGTAAEGWANACLRKDGALTVEPWMKIEAEFSGEWLDGAWCGVSQFVSDNMRWSATWVGERRAEGLQSEISQFVFGEHAVERTLAALDVPATCGSPTCGVDVAIVRGTSGKLEVRPMEVNARTTMSHYALASERRVPGARRFDVIRVSELAGRPELLPLTDPETAESFCAVVERVSNATAGQRGE